MTILLPVNYFPPSHSNTSSQLGSHVIYNINRENSKQWAVAVVAGVAPVAVVTTVTSHNTSSK